MKIEVGEVLWTYEYNRIDCKFRVFQAEAKYYEKSSGIWFFEPVGGCEFDRSITCLEERLKTQFFMTHEGVVTEVIGMLGRQLALAERSMVKLQNQLIIRKNQLAALVE